MLIAMLVGMAALYPLWAWGTAGVAPGFWVHRADVDALVMATAMTVPMVLWMRRRGHRSRAIVEMGVAMYAGVGLLIPLLWMGVLGPAGLLMGGHVLMPVLMLGAMLVRIDDYIGPDRPRPGGGVVVTATAGPGSMTRRVRIMVRWWPVLLAVALSALSWGIDPVTARELFTLLPLVYVAVVIVGRRSASWPLLALGSGCFLVFQLQTVVDPTLALATLAILVALLGFFVNDSRELVVQSSALVLWLVLVVATLAISADGASVLMAVAWATHGAWDLWHLRRDKVVSRTYAQWCAAFDILIAVQLITRA
ncbi:MAG: hypothetical protein ACRDPJ_18570 [Nocardioidaceae bacterium]